MGLVTVADRLSPFFNLNQGLLALANRDIPGYLADLACLIGSGGLMLILAMTVLSQKGVKAK